MKNLLQPVSSIRLIFLFSVLWFSTICIYQSFAQNADKAMNFENTKKAQQQLRGSIVKMAMTNNALPNPSTYFRAPSSDWQYMKSITLSSATNQDNYQIKVELTTSNFNYSHANTNGSDIRFYDENGTELNYWIEKWDASGTSIIWVKVPTAGTTEIFMHYGNSSAQSASNATNTFVRVINANSPVKGSWNFDEGSGTTANDMSGNGNNGTLYNSPTWVDGKYGEALSFNGNNYVDCGTNSSLNTPPQFTQEAWIYPTITDNDYHGFLGYQPSTNSIRSACLYVYQKYKIHAGFGDNNGWQSFITGNVITQNEWNYVVATFNGTDYKIYVNGVEKYSTSAFAGKTPYPTPIRYIGRVNNYFIGSIDEVRIYNRALTSEEVSDLYQNYGYTTTNAPGEVFVRKYSAPEPVATVGNETVIRIKYVATNGSNTPPYDTWGKAATSIQNAIDAASAGDTIIVGSSGTGHGDGVYTENVNVTKSLTIKSESGYEYTTVVAADANDHVFEVTANNVTIGGEGCGFSIYGATGFGSGAYYAGIYLGSSTTNCTIHDNRCGWDSEHYNTEGIYLFFSSNNTITGNTTSSNNDCGIFVFYSSNNILTNNNASNNSYGICLLNSSNNTIYLNNLCNNNPNGNAYVSDGSGNTWNSPTPIYYDYTGGSFHKNILGNYYGDYTGSDADEDGIGADLYTGVRMTDNYPLMTTSEHYSLQAWWLNNDGKMYRDDRTKAYGNVTLNAGNSQIWIASEVATKNISYSGNDTWTGQIVFTSAPANRDEFTVEIGSSTDGTDFISGGPQATITGDGYKTIFTFETNAAAFNLTNGNYLALRLTNNSSAYNHKVQTGGAWSYCSSAEIVTESPTGKNENILPHHFSLFQNQPNPFVTTTMIRYELPERSSVVLKVYDLFGREVTTLFEGEQNAGKYEVEFNGTNLPGGIYFYQLQAGNFTTVRKLLLLK